MGFRASGQGSMAWGIRPEGFRVWGSKAYGLAARQSSTEAASSTSISISFFKVLHVELGA